ncbi:putative phage transposase, partial [Pasteurella multocida subsp. multocida str. Anand1_buffalo]
CKPLLAVVPIAEMTVQQPNLELSRKFNEASDKAREKAKAKAEACLQLKAFLDQGFPMMSAIEGAAKVKNVSAGSLKNWYYKVQPYPVHEWQAVLITQSGKAKKPSRKAFIEQEAWDCFLADYLRPEK